jgi:alkylation response protein AidB-like acyl-CoA dehydrogenase
MSEWNEADLRDEVHAWLQQNWDPERGLVEWRNILADSGWGMPTWPTAWHGRGLPVGLGPVVEQAFREFGAIGVAKSGVRMLVAATLLEHGSDAHKSQFLRRILTGEDTWCQLFSEPGSGSDLAGLTTRAEFAGNQWTINGQKVWSTSAHKADWGVLLARTDWDAHKHAGLSYFVIDMSQAGVEARPLQQMNGYASFNEVFMTEATVPPEMLVGERGQGWQIATTTLMHERRNADSLRQWGRSEATAEGLIYEQEAAEIATVMEPYRWYPQRAGRVDMIFDRARQTGQVNDPVVRQEMAKLLTLSKSAEWTARRARAAQELGRPQGPEGSLGKLASSHVARAAAHVHTMISGTDAMLAGEDGAEDGLIAEILLSVPATSIAGGTDEIQRNIIAERVLKMPKETRVDTGRPFSEVRKNTVG